MQYSMVKENVSWRAPLSSWWVCAALAASALSLAGVALIDHALPEPLTRATAAPDRFIAEIAYEHLVNLTSIGPRVAGSYENEVLAVRVLVAAVHEIARIASPHNRLEVEVHSASGAFPLAFLDGMNNVYRGVQMVVVRVSGRGVRAGARRSALLLNCHFDTVPDSPGASDDGAGCAVLLETLRAVAVRPQPLRRDLLLLLNGAEENILQASHAFITTHRWAKSVRAFLNIEACGAGGREVLFQAGPHDPWIMEVYAGAVPHPFASSLAQELFESGLIPADTDYRIFRDFGNLSGVDLAWSANGYVYHTHLDTADNVPLSALQRTGDNVLALTHGLLQSEDLDSEVDKSSRQPVFFDVLGLVVVSARAPAALVAVAATVALVLLDVHLTALDASRELYVRGGWWWGAVGAALWAWARAHAAGVLASAAVAVALHTAGARLSFYARGWLLAPLYSAPALAAAWGNAAGAQPRGWGLRGWRGALAWRQAGMLWAAGVLCVCTAAGLRSGFLPLLWALCPAVVGVLGRAQRGGWLPVGWALGAALPALQTWYLALGSLRMFVPVLGRAGVGPVPADVMMAVLVSTLVLTACSWILPLVVAARNRRRLVWALWGACVAGCLVAVTSPRSAAYSVERPQRLMVFHVRRSVHYAGESGDSTEEQMFWVPELDTNTGHTVRTAVAAAAGAEARPVSAEECTRWPYCGVPYYLPVLSLIPSSYVVPAPAPPPRTLQVSVSSESLDDTTRLLQLNITGPSHVVVIVSPVAGAELSWSSAVAAPQPCRSAPGSDRHTYLFALYAARAPATWNLTLHLRHAFGANGSTQWADLSVAGHTLYGDQKLHEVHRNLLSRLPVWIAPTGWAVHQQLHRV